MKSENKKKIKNIILYIIVGIVIAISSAYIYDTFIRHNEKISPNEEKIYIFNENNYYYNVEYINLENSYDNKTGDSNTEITNRFINIISGLDTKTIQNILIRNAGRYEVEYALKYLYTINNINLSDEIESYSIDFLNKTNKEQNELINCNSKNVIYLQVGKFYTTSRYVEWRNLFGKAVRVSKLRFVNHPDADPLTQYYTYYVYIACRQDKDITFD